MNADPFLLDKSWLRRSFDRASATYDDVAVLQTEVRGLLLERLNLTTLSPRVVADIGAGTGHAANALKRRYPHAQVIALDLSRGMLRAGGRRSWLRPVKQICADAEQLPLAAGSVDLLFSNFMLEWTDPDRTLAEFRRVLSPRGLLTFTTLGPDTLKELRSAWSRAGELPTGSSIRVGRFADMHDLGDGLVRAGFAAPVLDVEHYTLSYPDFRRLAEDLRALGAQNAALGRPRGLTGPRRFAAMVEAYDAFRIDGRLPATYEVIFGQAWAPATSPIRDDPSSAVVSLEEMRRQLKAAGD